MANVLPGLEEVLGAPALPLHFDVPGHYLPAGHYITAIKSVKTVMDELSRRAFEDKLRVELIVLPAEHGSFKSITKVVVKTAKGVTVAAGTLGGMIAFTETNTFKGLVTGLTGREFDHYEVSKDVGELIRDMALGIFTTENEKLDKAIPADVNLDRAIRAKSDFYVACAANPTVSGVGFTEEPEFPIKRASFPFHISRDRVRPVESDFRLYEAIIISPVDVDKDIKWEFQDTETKAIIRAHMRDEDFKRKFLNGTYPLKKSNHDDVVKILVEYRMQEKNGEIEIKDTLVNAVFSFNNTEISAIPDSHNLRNRGFNSSASLPLWGTF